MSKSALISGEEIHQVSLIPFDNNSDIRGSFVEVFQKSWDTVIDPVQWSIVKSKKNVLRGMHYHKRHDEYFSLVEGHCLVGLKDVRPESPSYGSYSLYELFSEDTAGLIFPRGIIHGWYFYQNSIHLQGVSESYVDYHNDDNFGCQWNDKGLGIPWAIEEPILSERSKSFSSESELIEKNSQ